MIPPPLASALNFKFLCHLSNSGMHFFFKNLLLYSQAYIRQTKHIEMITKEGSTKIVNFMTPGAGVLVLGHGHISNIVKIHYFFKKSSTLLPGIYQTKKYIVIITKEGSTIIVTFMTPWPGVLC